MRVAVIHSFYSASQPSGENRVVEDQVEALREAGHKVELIRKDTDQLTGRFYGIRTALNVAVSEGFNPLRRIRKFKPDIVHVHNTFPNIGSNWTIEWDGPLVVSLHNYRLWCSNGIFYRKGHVCMECVSSDTSRAIVNGCFRGSRIATVPVALSRSRERRNLLYRANAIVTTSELSDAVIRGLVDREIPTTMIPNFGADEADAHSFSSLQDGWIALGRFTPEKGFIELLQDWPADERLIIVGDGPMRTEIIRGASERNVEIIPTLSRDDMRTLMKQSVGLVFPSRWFEVDPQVVVEAMRIGLPVVALAGNAVARIVERTHAGAVYGDTRSLTEALQVVRGSREVMAQAALAEFQRRWTKSAWLKLMSELYANVISGLGAK